MLLLLPLLLVLLLLCCSHTRTLTWRFVLTRAVSDFRLQCGKMSAVHAMRLLVEEGAGETRTCHWPCMPRFIAAQCA